MAENDLKVIQKAKELATHTLKVTSNANRYPKKYRFSLVDKMQNKSMEIYESFSLVVFDLPHLRYAGKTGYLAKKYGRLDEHWPEMLHDGFQECMRVLKEDGVLIFKWAETDIPAQKVWKAIGQKPLFGHHSGKRSGTFWGCYMKGQK